MRIFKYGKKAAPFAAGIILLIIGGYLVWTSPESRAAADLMPFKIVAGFEHPVVATKAGDSHI